MNESDQGKRFMTQILNLVFYLNKSKW